MSLDDLGYKLVINEDDKLLNGEAAYSVGKFRLGTTDMGGALMDQEHGQLLGEIIGGGSLPKLEELDLGWNESLGGGVVPIMAGLEGGGCRHLKGLDIAGVGMGPQGGHALARALASGNLSCLEDINLGPNEMVGDHAVAEVIKGLRECHQLRELHVGHTGMGVMAGQALV